MGKTINFTDQEFKLLQRLLEQESLNSIARCVFHKKNGDDAEDPETSRGGRFGSSFFCKKCDEAQEIAKAKLRKKMGIKQ